MRLIAAFLLALALPVLAQQQPGDPYQQFMPQKWGDPTRVTYTVECVSTRHNTFEVGISTSTVVHSNTWADLDEATWLGWERAYSIVQTNGIEAWGSVATQAADGQNPGSRQVLDALGLSGTP